MDSSWGTRLEVLDPGMNCARQKTNILAHFFSLLSGEKLCLCFLFFIYIYIKECVSMSGLPVEIWLYRACQRYPCTLAKSNTIDYQSANVFFPPNARSSKEKCKKWQWSENFTETSGMKKLPRKRASKQKEGTLEENLPFFILAVTFFFSMRASWSV